MPVAMVKLKVDSRIGKGCLIMGADKVHKINDGRVIITNDGKESHQSYEARLELDDHLVNEVGYGRDETRAIKSLINDITGFLDGRIIQEIQKLI